MRIGLDFLGGIFPEGKLGRVCLLPCSLLHPITGCVKSVEGRAEEEAHAWLWCPGLAPAPACLAFTQDSLTTGSSLTRKLGRPPQPSGWWEALGSLYILPVPRVWYHVCAKDVTSPAPTSHVGARTRFPLDIFSVESSKASQLVLPRTDAVTLPFLSLALPAWRPTPHSQWLP